MRIPTTHREDNAHKRSLESRRIAAITFGQIAAMQNAIETMQGCDNNGVAFIAALAETEKALANLAKFF